ncbi:MAG TPA: transposase [Pyrinomonadaceae bacterium]|nr:transposase [Pyrinomonadaceae bacterium]HMP65639.1 transposase [Pyrinomonadaceae bacterium]
MARKPRIEIEGGLYHVITRGNDRQDIFHSREDHLKFISLIEKAKQQLGFYFYAYCLMSNHLHLLIERRSETVGRIMQRVLTGYSQYYNKRYNKVGHLFQGRHKAILCQSDPYLARLVRYIHLNPVRANMVATPEEYPYSSHRAYLGIEPYGVIDVDPVLRRFGPSKRKAHERYAAFMREPTNEREDDTATFYANGEILGTDEFVDDAIHRMGEVENWASKHKDVTAFDAELLLSSIEDVFEMRRENFFGAGKNSRIITAKEVCILIGKESGATITELAKIVGLDQSNASRRCDAARRKLSSDIHFASVKKIVEENYRARIAISHV